MRGLKLMTVIMVIMAMVLSGCSLFLVEEESQDKVCVARDKLEDLGVDVDALLAEGTSTPSEEGVEQEPVVENETLVGNDKDEHGCIGSAGYVWCEDTQECVRPWETDCPSLESEEPVEETEGSEETEEETEETEEPAEEEEEATDDLPVKTFTEGELVKVSPKTAVEGVTFAYSAPLDENGEWQTQAGDAGEYVVDVTATNEAGSLTKQIRIVVLAGNSAPELTVDDVTVTAGETVTLSPTVSDADGDEVTLSYSGFMTESSMETTNDDVGEHTVTVTADDGTVQVTADVIVTVTKLNHAPVLAELSPVTVTEGDLISVEATATDEDGDEVSVVFSEPLSEEGEWQTEVGDAGTYSVTATATDGELEDTKSFSIIVEAANSAPVVSHETPVEVSVTEGETATVTLSPTVTDADGDEVTVTYAGFMTEATKTVTDADEGSHTVTITANDGQASSTFDVTVVVDVNTPPEFSFD